VEIERTLEGSRAQLSEATYPYKSRSESVWAVRAHAPGQTHSHGEPHSLVTLGYDIRS